jgi:hypothetical protein
MVIGGRREHGCRGVGRMGKCRCGVVLSGFVDSIQMMESGDG